MAKKITIDGVVLPITDAFSRDVVAPLRKRDFRMGEIENQVKALERQSNLRALTGEEEGTKDRLVKIWNVGNSVRLCAGRPLSDFRFEGADQLHHNHETHECGCKLHFVFDHYLAAADKDFAHHPHHIVRSCADHAHLAKDFRAHFHAVREATRARNKAKEEAEASE